MNAVGGRITVLRLHCRFCISRWRLSHARLVPQSSDALGYKYCVQEAADLVV